jgi:galactokinase
VKTPAPQPLNRSNSQLFLALQAVYGNAAEDQVSRYSTAIDQFINIYGPGPTHIFRAPGRVNLIGEHTDYNHGYVLPVALDKDTLLLARPRHDRIVCLSNCEPEFADASFRIDDVINPASLGNWTNYVRGAAQMIVRQAIGDASGFDGLVIGGLPNGVPRGSGLSSSSALTVAAASALAHFSDLQVPGPDFATLCAEAEWYVGTRGGVMDHFVGIMAKRDHALFLDCRPSDASGYASRHIALPHAYRLMVMDSGVHHSNVRGEFNQRVAACRAGVSLLGKEYPHITHLRDVQRYRWADLEPLLPEKLTAGDLSSLGLDIGDIPGLDPNDVLHIRSCCRHVWHENLRVLSVLDALQSGDAIAAGHLLNEAHASARDDYRISTLELDLLVSAALEVDGVVGSRLTGAGWGGCVLALVHEEAVDALWYHIRRSYESAFGRQPAMFLCRAGGGAGLVTTILE